MAGGSRDLSDAELVLLAQAGGAGAADAERDLCLRFLPRIRVFFARELSGIFEIDDLAHDTVLALLQAVRSKRVEEPHHVGAYALGICRNKVREVVRQRQRCERALRRIEPEPIAATPVPRLQIGRLEECLHTLTDRARTVLRMTLVEGAASAAVARELDMSETNVRVVRHRAIERLRRCLGVGRYAVQQR